MKLVDILARDLTVWPVLAKTLRQAVRGMVFFDPYGGKILEVARFDLADDWRDAQVTQAQWQAAVDALKSEVHPTESMALHHQEVGRITRQWNGEGLPPAGSSVEAALPEWTVVDVIAHGINFGVLVAVLQVGDKIITKSDGFRPIRTPEQIAADERHKALIEMLRSAPAMTTCVAGALYDAGYRKFEIVDN